MPCYSFLCFTWVFSSPQGCGLKDITCLQEYIHLQNVVLSHNSLTGMNQLWIACGVICWSTIKKQMWYFKSTDLSPLGCMPYLVFLDVSHNELTTVLDFKPPLGLRVRDWQVMYRKIILFTWKICFHFQNNVYLTVSLSSAPFFSSRM